MFPQGEGPARALKPSEEKLKEKSLIFTPDCSCNGDMLRCINRACYTVADSGSEFSRERRSRG